MKISEIDFRSLDVKEMGLWPPILRMAVFVAVGIATLIAGYIIILSHQITLLDTQDQQEISKRKEFQDKYNLAANLTAYEKQMVEIKSSYKKTLRELPLSDLLPELIDNISQIAKDNNVKPKAIKPGKEVAILGFYKEMPIGLVLDGFYNGFGGFISDISNLSRVVTLHDFSLKRINSSKDAGGHGLLTLEIDAKTYWLSNEKQSDNEGENKSSKTGKKSAAGQDDEPTGASSDGSQPGLNNIPIARDNSSDGGDSTPDTGGAQ